MPRVKVIQSQGEYIPGVVRLIITVIDNIVSRVVFNQNGAARDGLYIDCLIKTGVARLRVSAHISHFLFIQRFSFRTFDFNIKMTWNGASSYVFTSQLTSDIYSSRSIFEIDGTYDGVLGMNSLDRDIIFSYVIFLNSRAAN